ncbi:MAG: hypothetical protein H7Y36_09370 [Armatimonadetes bacterium]|nr:hypothetical protein [Akkermansiaceae bacterium]
MSWNRNFWVWGAFGSCAFLVIAAMWWLTHNVLRTERDRAIAEIRAELQERVRLSLWRMDSLGASILLEENAIPTQLFLSEPQTTLPVIVRFETPDGAAIRGNGDPQALESVGGLLPQLITSSETSRNDEKSEDSSISRQEYAPPTQSKMRGDEKAQAAANWNEKENRVRLLDKALSKTAQNYGTGLGLSEAKTQSTAPPEIPAPGKLEVLNPIGEFKPIWYDQSLFLIRRGMSLQSFAQGSLIAETKLKTLLLSEASQLLPEAKLIRVFGEPDDSFVLASFPFKLSPGSLGTPLESVPHAISISLLVGWLAAGIALLAASLLIANVMKLSERRAAFVSAVTHELRTPLTTFRLYSDMLSTGAVREEKRPAYLQVLSREADRLSHLVENVLAFSKLERGSARSSVAEKELGGLLESMRERFESRLDAAGLKLELRATSPMITKLDASALEHILFNLIDNAAKYAANSQPPIVLIEAIALPGKIEISLSDHGPGISKKECCRIFRPFHKSAKQAAETKPGVGLGLALSKRLAIAMGGTLVCEARKDGGSGAVFILTLPRI